MMTPEDQELRNGPEYLVFDEILRAIKRNAEQFELSPIQVIGVVGLLDAFVKENGIEDMENPGGDYEEDNMDLP